MVNRRKTRKAGNASPKAKYKRIRLSKRKCLNCKKKYRPKRKEQKYCSDHCRKRAYEKRQMMNLFANFLDEQAKKIRQKINKQTSETKDSEEFLGG